MDNMTQTEPNEQALKLLQVQVPSELVKRLRVAAIARDTNASAIVADLLATLPPVGAGSSDTAPTE
jgi:hypothetical protein